MAIKDPIEEGVLRHPGADDLHEGALVQLDPRTLTVNEHNIRFIDSEAVKDLSDLDSIATEGVLEPLIVTPDRQVVCGHRRRARAIMAGRETVPCIIRTLSDTQQVTIALIENLGRTGITPSEEAAAYQTMIDLGIKPKEVAGRVGVKPARVTDTLSLLKLPKVARDALANGQITLGLAKRLLALKDHPKEIEKLAKRFPKEAGMPMDQMWEIDGVIRTVQTRATKKRLEEQAVKDGLTVVAAPPYYGRQEGDPVRIGTGLEEVDLPLAKHEKMKCHAVAVDASGETGRLIPICTDLKRHKGVKDPSTRRGSYTDHDWEAERRERERVNEGLREARESRLALWRTAIANTEIEDIYRVGTVGTAVLSRDVHEICALVGLEVEGEADASFALLDWLVEDPDQRDARERLVYRALLAQNIENRVGDTYRGWAAPFIIQAVEAMLRMGHTLNAVEQELWDATADLRQRMTEDPRSRYVVLSQGEPTADEGESDDLGADDDDDNPSGDL